MFSYIRSVLHKSAPIYSKSVVVMCCPFLSPMSSPENVLSMVKMFGQVLSSLYTLTLAVDSFDFCTPNRHEPKWKN